MSAEGSIREQPLPEVLLDLGREGRTGILTIQGQQEIIAFSFLHGSIVSADALNQTMEDGLGVVLADLDLVSGHQFAELAAEYQAGGGQVVDLLVERGFIERPQLLDAVRNHTYLLCRQALGWTEGDYKFYQGEEVSYEEGVLPIPPEELLIRAGGDLGQELLPGGFPGDDDVFKRSRGAGGAPEMAGGDDGEMDQATLDTFKLIDGKRAVADLSEASGAPSYRVAYLLNRWQQLGLVERSKKSRKRKPAPSKSSAEKVETGEPRVAKPPRESRLIAAWRRWRERPASESHPWPARILGLGLMALLATSFATSPSHILLPFPWQRGLQEGLEREHVGAELSRLRRANSAYFLLQGRFSESLSDLATSRLLPSVDLADETGRPLSYSATEASYVVRSSAELGADPETYLQETIRGNFLLDPELELPADSREPLLVLLD